MFEKISSFYYRQQIILKRRPGELAMILIHPFIALISLGILASFVISGGAHPSSMMFVFVGVIIWNFYDLVQRGITFGITFDIWSESMKHTFSSSSTPKDFILGNSLFGLRNATFTFALVGVVGFLSFGFNIFAAGLALINLIPVFIFSVAIGLMINSLIISKGEKYMAMIWIMTGVIMILSGVYYPASLLPTPIAEISQALPPTHSIASMRAAFGYSSELLVSEFLTGFLLSIVYLLAGISIFKYGLKKGYENGTITKY